MRRVQNMIKLSLASMVKSTVSLRSAGSLSALSQSSDTSSPVSEDKKLLHSLVNYSKSNGRTNNCLLEHNFKNKTP